MAIKVIFILGIIFINSIISFIFDDIYMLCIWNIFVSILFASYYNMYIKLVKSLITSYICLEYSEELKEILKIHPVDKLFLNNMLYWSCEGGGNNKIVRILLESGADPNYRCMIRHALRDCNTNIVSTLIEYGAKDYNLRDAIVSNNIDNIKYIINLTDDGICPGLIIASRKGNSEVIKLLIDHGANVNYNNDMALITACRFGYIDCVKILIDNGANLRALDNKAIKLAFKYNKYETLYYLLKKYTELSTLPEDNMFIVYAASIGSIDLIKILHHSGLKIDCYNNWPLRIAVENNKVDMVEYLIKSGADINIYNGIALRKAIKYRYKDIIELLLRNGAYMSNTKYENMKYIFQ